MADNLTHGLAGALLAQTGFQQRYGPAAPSSASCTTGG